MALDQNKILLIEDEESLNEAIRFSLELEGYEVSCFFSGKKALLEVNLNAFDLVILDVMLPEMNGWEVCESIRKKSDVPIIFLSAKGESTDKIKGLRLGGNDYLSKPFDMEELLLRIEKQIPKEIESTDQIEIATAKIDFSAYEIDGIQGKVQIPQREMEVLKILVKNAGKVVEKNQLQDQVWTDKKFPGGRTLDNYISNLRKHIEKDPKNPKYLFTQRGVGYKFQYD